MEIETFFTAWYLFVACLCVPFDVYIINKIICDVRAERRDPVTTVFVPVIGEPEPIPKTKIPRRGKGFVYILRDTEVTGWCKIGHTNNPRRRIGRFDTKLPFATEVLYIIPADDRMALEHKLHFEFRDKRKRGEWFDLDDNDIAAIKRLT